MNDKVIAKPSKNQIAWHERERIMFVCLDPATWQGREYDNHSTPLYKINPSKLNTDQWCEAAVSWGAKTILFVAKHTGGFCWWHTDTSEYGIKETPYKNGKGDVLKEVSESCKKFGLSLAVYVYPGDDNWEAYIGGGGRTKDPSKQEEYNGVYRQQLTEVLTKYGDISEVWFDGSIIIPVSDILHKYAPNAVFFQGPNADIRWAGTEAGEVPYPTTCAINSETLKTGVSTAANGNVDGDIWAPVEVNTTLYDHFWFWAKDKEKKRKSLDRLMECYYKSVGRGLVFLLNSTPNTSGLIPDNDMCLYKQFGDEIKRRFDNPVAKVSNCLTLKFDKTNVNHIIIEEDYTQGERVRAFTLKAKTKNGYKEIYKGSIIGRKHIAVFNNIVTDEITLQIDEEVLPHIIKKISAYNVTEVNISKFIKQLSAGIELCDAFKEQTVCKWSKKSFALGRAEIDLTKHITMAGEYLVDFNCKNPFDLIHCEGLMDGNICDNTVNYIGNGQFRIRRTAATTDETTTKLIIHAKPKFGKFGKVKIKMM